MTIPFFQVTCKNPAQHSVSVGGRVCLSVNVGTGGYYKEWLDSLPICDSDNESSQTVNSAEGAGIAIGGWYVTAFNHIECPGGIPKKRLV